MELAAIFISLFLIISESDEVKRFSEHSNNLHIFEEGTADYNHSDAEGFIKLNALRLRVAEMVRQKNHKN